MSAVDRARREILAVMSRELPPSMLPTARPLSLWRRVLCFLRVSRPEPTPEAFGGALPPSTGGTIKFRRPKADSEAP